MPAFVQSYSQSQARLMFVTTLGMDNFDCTKMNAHFEKFTACLREGLIHEWKQTLLAPPLPLISLNNSRLCSTDSHCSASLWVPQCSTNDKLRILVKAQPSTRSTWPRSPTRLGIRPRDLGLLLGHCGLSAASRHKLAFTSRHHIEVKCVFWLVDWNWSGPRTNQFLLDLCVCWWCGQTGVGALERVQIFLLAEGLKIEVFGIIR